MWLKPSWHCGPFSGYDRIYKVFTRKLMAVLPVGLHGTLDYITSPGIVIPTLVLLILVIYYLISLTGLLKESNQDLRDQLHLERTEERRKLVKAATGSGNNAGTSNVSLRWKGILESAITSSNENSRNRDCTY